MDVLQSDASPATHASVILCQITSVLADAPDFRVTVSPDAGNGLPEPWQIIADKPVTVCRARVERLRAGPDGSSHLLAPSPLASGACINLAVNEV